MTQDQVDELRASHSATVQCHEDAVAWCDAIALEVAAKTPDAVKQFEDAKRAWNDLPPEPPTPTDFASFEAHQRWLKLAAETQAARNFAEQDVQIAQENEEAARAAAALVHGGLAKARLERDAHAASK